MNELDLFEQIQNKMALLETALRTSKERGIEYAEAEKQYQIAKNQSVLLLRANDTPATLIQLMVKGEKDVAEKMIKRDIAKTLYESSVEAINVYKLEIRVIQAELDREWSNVDHVHQ